MSAPSATPSPVKRPACSCRQVIRPDSRRRLSASRRAIRYASNLAERRDSASNKITKSVAAHDNSATFWKAFMHDQNNFDTGPSVAYILKGFPRLSETFIASEIYRLEQSCIRLRLFVIKATEG